MADANQGPGFLMWQVTNAWQRQVRAALAPLELTHVQYAILASLVALENQDGVAVTQRAVGDAAASDPMTTSQVVRGLEARKLLTRRTHPSDGRAWRLGTTASGRRLVSRADPLVRAADASFFAGLNRGRLDQLSSALFTLAHKG